MMYKMRKVKGTDNLGWCAYNLRIMPHDKKEPFLDHIRHSLAHLLAAAVIKKFPDAKLGIGPTIDEGFYYDFLLPRTLTPDDLKEFEKAMKKMIGQKLPFTGKEITAAEAKKFFKDQLFKLELIEEFSKESKKLTAYSTGDIFTDLCRGGHVENTKEIDADGFKLDRLAGAYWRGDEKNPQLQRIYGLAFENSEALKKYLDQRAEAEKRDHKKLGPKLELFMFHETAPGMPYWLPNGVLLYNQLVDFWRQEHVMRDYHEIISPLINKKELYQTSGHFEHYWENMFVSKTPDKEEYGLKAMNCPNAMIVFGSKPRSYKELPLRFSDTDTLHRYERSGTLNGLLRVREFRQDDAHCFVTEDQIPGEYERIFEIVERFYSVFNLSYSFRLGTRPESFMGEKQTWDHAEAALKKILEKSKREYSIKEGDGAFYGPKIDILMKDAIGREWQMGTIQLDFQQPLRFKLEYTDKDGGKKTPAAIHRVIYGSLERFIGILIEHFSGAFPLWLSPVQVEIIPVGEKFEEYGKGIKGKLLAENIRVSMKPADETLGKRIREAEMMKIPYVLVVGEKEEKNETVNVRHYKDGQSGELSTNDLVKKLLEEIREKKI